MICIDFIIWNRRKFEIHHHCECVYFSIPSILISKSIHKIRAARSKNPVADNIKKTMNAAATCLTHQSQQLAFDSQSLMCVIRLTTNRLQLKTLHVVSCNYNRWMWLITMLLYNYMQAAFFPQIKNPFSYLFIHHNIRLKSNCFNKNYPHTQIC